MKFTIDGHECLVFPEMLSIRIGIDEAEYRVFFKEENNRQVVSKIVPEPENQTKSGLLDQAIEKYWEARAEVEKESYNSMMRRQNDLGKRMPRVEYSFFNINGTKVGVFAYSICRDLIYRVNLNNVEYEIFSESLCDIDRPPGKRYGDLVYLEEVKSTNGSIASAEEIDLIEKAITGYNQDREPGYFVEFRRDRDLEL